MNNPKLFDAIDTGLPGVGINGWDGYHSEITLRDLFAGLAMNGCIAHHSSTFANDERKKQGSKWAYQVADAMLKAREAASER